MYKILVCEDSIIVNQHICKTLEVAGYEVDSAYTGSEGVTKAGDFRPDLILMDIMMETQDDGIQASMEIKNSFDLPVIFLTALTDEGTLDRVKESQPYGYIVKPFNETELLSNIKVAIHKSKVENEVKENRDLLQASINSINQAFFLIKSDFSVYYLNKRAEDLLGKNFNDVVGADIERALPLKDKNDQLLERNELLKLSGDSEVVFKTATGQLHFGDFVIKQVEVKDGTYKLFLFKEISDRVKARKLEQEMEQRRIASLIEGQENERNRLAREIHDGVGQMINLIKLKVSSLPADHKKDLQPILEQTLTEVRNVTENLHPTRLNDFSLEKNLDGLISQVGKTSGINFSFSSSDVPEISHFQKTHLFRIAQEAISNILKHSDASEAAIQLIGLQDEVQLTIEDDGVGYDASHSDDGYAHHGLQNIQYRVDSLNGKFTLDSNSDGTMLLISIPVN